MEVDPENKEENMDESHVEQEQYEKAPLPSQKEIILSSLETPSSRESGSRESESEEEEESGEQKEAPRSIALELGDIIEIVAPTHTEIHQTTAIITYIDPQKIKLIDVATGIFHQLNVLENGQLSDESITQLILLNRSEESGYARQNGLLPRTWVDLHFGGEIPAIITAEITNLEEDQIELTTFPELRVLYIDFAYQGIPETIPLESIVLREKPASMGKVDSVRDLQAIVAEEGNLEEALLKSTPSSEMASVTQTPTGETILTVPENVKTDENIRETLHTMYIDAHSIFFGERLPEIAHLVEIPESQQRYSVEVQANDLMDELLSTVPNSQRTKLVLDTVHLLIERFKELRQQCSHFDMNSNVFGVKTYGAFYKPLVEHILHMDTKLRWLLPVVKNRRKIYDVDFMVDAEDTVPEKIAENLLELQAKQLAYYTSNNSNDLTLSYSTFHKYVHSWFEPVEPPMSNCIATLPVHTQVTALIDNLGDYYSTAYACPDENQIYQSSEPTMGLVKRRFLQQTYTTGLTHLDEYMSHAGKKSYTREKMTDDESLCLQSFLMFPASIAQYSNLFLSGTGLLQSISLHQTPFYLFRLLHRRLDIPVFEINDLSKEISYKEGEENTFLKEFREFSVDPQLLHESDLLEKTLEVMVPKIYDLIKGTSLSRSDKTSFSHVVAALRPFLIFPEHITFQQHKLIRYLIKENLLELRKSIETKRAEFSLLLSAKYNVTAKKNPVMRLLNENTEFAETFLKGYSVLTSEEDPIHTPWSSAELLSHIYAGDNARLFTNFITSMLITVLNTPQHILDGFVPAELDDISKMEKIKAKDSAVRYLAKRYDSIRALQKDNNVDDLYYDPEFDNTPYEILEKYRDDKKRMSPDMFFEFLMENLIQKHDCPPEMARDLAATLIAKKKRVVDGEYAVLEIRPHLPENVVLSPEESKSAESEAEIRQKTEYYTRRKGVWVSDPSIGKAAFLDNAELFANISAAFFKKGEKAACEDVSAVTRMKQIAVKQFTQELDKRVTIHADDLANQLERNIDYHLKTIRRLNLLKEIQATRANRLAYDIGSYANKADLIVSPHATLADLILGQDDFAKKQFDICRFVETFCREPMVAEREEEPYWFYCKDTNTRLFPCSLYQLADVFVSGGNYIEELGRICRTDGILSEDGDAIVDKHTGRILRKIDFVAETDFTVEGFPITTHALLEKDMATQIEEAKKAGKTRPVFENPVNETIYNVTETLCKHVDIPLDSVLELVMRVSYELSEKYIAKQEAYEKRSAKQEKEKGKRLAPYTKYREETLLNIIASVLLAAIQTATPSFQTRKTFPGCVRSFQGYPLNGGAEDQSSIQYMACIIKKTATSSAIAPWGSVKGYSAEILAKRIKDMMENYLLKRGDMEQLYMQKREYLLLHADTNVPVEHDISRWQRFLPPVVPFEIMNRLHPISSDFRDDLMDVLRDGKRDQFVSLSALHSKIVQYGYACIELINNVVQSKMALLKTSTLVPFLENACCSESSLFVPYLYFNAEDAHLVEYTKHVNTIKLLSEFVREISIAPLFFHVPFTGIVFPSVPSGQLEETIYAAVIHYCHLDRPELPVPAAFATICSEKPANYVNSWTLLEKMEFLKRNGKRYTMDTLNQLMRMVYDENRVSIDIPLAYSSVDSFREIVQHYDLINSSLFDETIRSKLTAVLDTYRPTQRVAGDSPPLEDLKRYLSATNRNMYRTIMSFFDVYGNLNNTNYKKMGEFLSTLCDWKSKREENAVYDDELFRVAQYVKNMVYMFSKVYPAILQEKNGFYAKVSAHWGLSKQHHTILTTVFKKYFSGIEAFQQDDVLKLLLADISPKMGELHLFLQNMPMQTEIVKPMQQDDGEWTTRVFHGLFDKETVFALLTYCAYSTLYEYVMATDDPEVLRADLQASKQNRRAENAAMGNDANFLQTIAEENEEEDQTLQEVQIQMGDKLELKQRLCSLLLTCLEVDQKNKTMVEMTYQEVMEKVNRSKEKEKRAIIENFSKMNEERRVENMLKNFRIGRWNVGQQKGLIQYDKETFDREINELKLQAMADIESGREDVMTGMVRDIYELDRAADVDAEEEGDQEAYGIADLGENYMDGEYYAEDREDDFLED